MKKRGVFFSTIAFSMVLGSFSYCATPNDIRSFVGLSPIDKDYPESERIRIKEEYTEIERYNKLAQMLIDSNGDRSVLDEEIDAEIKVLKEELKKSVDSLYDSFNKGSVSSVKEKSTAVSNIETKLGKVREKGNAIEMKLKENTLIADYEKVIALESILSEEKDIGKVGNILKSPLEVKLDIVEPFGKYTTKEGRVMDSKTVKLRGTTNNNVMSLWGGVVKTITPIGDGLFEVVVEHSPYMYTKYTNVREVKVEEGTKVNQYTYIGKLGSVGSTEAPYLTFEVVIDGGSVNPMHFFGKVGVNAIKEYVSKTGSKLDISIYSNVKEGLQEDEKQSKPIYDKNGEVPDDAIVPSLTGRVPNPSTTLYEDELEADITSREENKGSSIKNKD